MICKQFQVYEASFWIPFPSVDRRLSIWSGDSDPDSLVSGVCRRILWRKTSGPVLLQTDPRSLFGFFHWILDRAGPYLFYSLLLKQRLYWVTALLHESWKTGLYHNVVWYLPLHLLEKLFSRKRDLPQITGSRCSREWPLESRFPLNDGRTSVPHISATGYA